MPITFVFGIGKRLVFKVNSIADNSESFFLDNEEKLVHHGIKAMLV
jgi:hypothetical protein